MTGNTAIAPTASFRSTTDFDSAFVLLGWEQDEWRLAARAEEFHTRSHNSFGASPATGEYGTVMTFAASWLPNDWMKLTGELIALQSKRGERMISSLSS